MSGGLQKLNAHPEGNTEDYVTALDGLTDHATGPQRDHTITATTPVNQAVKHPWLAKLIPGIEKLAASEHVGTFVATARGPNPPKAWESMPIYVRLGMQALYRGKAEEKLLSLGKVEGMLRQQSIKMGAAYDSEVGVLPHILAFNSTYDIQTSELLVEDLSAYKCFNDYFSRALKPDARLPAFPDDRRVVSSAADCRLQTYGDVQAAQRFWIKGTEFTLANLFQDEELAREMEGGAVAIFRLAPADYHRWHSAVDGVLGPTKSIPGQYYTVNPVAVMSELNVFTANRRDVTTITLPSGGKVVSVAVGAMLVGSVVQTRKEGDVVRRGEELGLFRYGGSTVINVFQKGAVQWDDDLVANGQVPIETVVRVGEKIGKFV